MNVARRLFSGTKDVKRKTAAPRIGEGVASSHPSPDDQDLVDEEDEEQEAEEEEEDEEEEDEAEGAVPIVARNRKERRDSITETIVKGWCLGCRCLQANSFLVFGIGLDRVYFAVFEVVQANSIPWRRRQAP